MKQIALLFLLLPIWAFSQVASVLMVQDDQETIENTLKSLYEGGIRQFVLYDTGSVDSTLKIIEGFFHDHQIEDALVVQEAFVNGAESRNRALDLAKEHFPNTPFLLMPSSGWILHNGEELLKFCEEEKAHPRDAYLIQIKAGTINHYAARLIHAQSDAHFVGLVDELLVPYPENKVPSPIYFEFGEKKVDPTAFVKKTEEEIDILLQSIKANPYDSRALFFLAQNYALIGNQLKAYDYFKKRIHMQGDPEEKYLATYRLAQVIELMGVGEHDTWGEAMEYYLQAYTLRPHRIEPLIRIALHYQEKGDHANAFLFANRAWDVPYPHQDKLYIETDYYNFTRYDILSRCAYYVGESDVGLKATLAALKARPMEGYLHYNYNFYHVNERGWVKAYPEKQKRELLITSCPKGGTAYTAKLLSHAGLKLGHEFLDQAGIASWPMTVVVSSSPFGPPRKNVEFTHIFHQASHPLFGIEALLSEPEESREYIRAHIPQIKNKDSSVCAAAKMWYYWNLKAEEQAELVFRVEEMEQVFGEIEKRLGVKLDRYVLNEVAKPQTASHLLTWDVLKKEIDPKLFCNIQQMARRFGYRF